jgi:flagellin-like hook-associated protein FlgL
LVVTSYLGNGDGTFSSGITALALPSFQYPHSIASADLDDDGKMDLVVSNQTVNNNMLIYLKGNGDGTFSIRQSVDSNVPSGLSGLSITDLNRDGLLDVIGNTVTSNVINVFLMNANGTFNSGVSYATGTQPYMNTLADINEDGFVDVLSANYSGQSISVNLSNGDGSFRLGNSITGIGQTAAVVAADFNNDSRIDLAATNWTTDQVRIFTAQGTRALTQEYLNLSSKSSARSAIDTLRGYLERLSQESSSLGAVQSRFTTAMQVASVMHENYTAAAGRIMDADIAEESALLVRQQILQRVGTAILAQANQKSSIVLQLL